MPTHYLRMVSIEKDRERERESERERERERESEREREKTCFYYFIMSVLLKKNMESETNK